MALAAHPATVACQKCGHHYLQPCHGKRRTCGNMPALASKQPATAAPRPTPVRATAPVPPPVTKGTPVFAVWPQDGAEYPATVARVLKQGYDVRWDDGGLIDRVATVRRRPDAKVAARKR